MKAKTKKRLIIWLAILLSVAIIGYVGYRAALVFVGDKAIDILLQNQLNSMLDSGELTLEELEAIAENEPAAATEEASAVDATEQNTEEAAQTAAPQQEQNKTETTQATKPSDNTPTKQETKPAEKPAEEKPQQEQAQKTEKPAEEKPQTERKETVKKAADNIGYGITRADKEAMAKLITSRLSGSDIAYLSGLLSGGLTREERAEAYKVAVARFSGAELSQVSSFYHKYKKAIMIEPDWGVEE